MSLFNYVRSFSTLAVAVMIWGCGLLADQQQTAPPPKGIVRVSGFDSPQHEEFKFADGTILGERDLNHPRSFEVNYNDGGKLVVGTEPVTRDEVRNRNYAALAPFCRTAPCVTASYNGHYYAFSPLDGQVLMDTELWVFVDIDAKQDALKFQGCNGGQIYSASDLMTLMDVLDPLRDPRYPNSTPVAAKYRIPHDREMLRLPVCNWRHRVGLDAVYPAPADVAKRRIVPASHTRPEFVEVKGDKAAVDTYVDQDHGRIERFVIKSSTASISIRPMYNDVDCPLFERCEHLVMGPEKQPNRFDIHSLDDEPLFYSRLYEVRDTANGKKTYDGCEGGRLYTGKSREAVEDDIKVAVDNPAPKPLKGAPLLGAPATAENGDVVIPDAFCDWSFRREQNQLLMQKAQAAH